MSYRTALIGAVSLSLSLPALTSPALAQDAGPAETTLDPIIVEGSRLGQTETEVGSSVTIITAEEIDALGFDFALDAVAAAPGVTINSNGAFGGSASVRIRGASSEQTLVLIDGVPVNDPTSPGGGFNFARLDTENIARIEVLKGPQSTLWGTDAIGGVVSITTKRPDPGLGGSVFGEYGSFNTFRGGASVENANDTGAFRLALVGTSSDGISKADEDNGNAEDDAYEALTLSAKGALNLAGDARVTVDALWTDAESEFDSFDFSAQGSVSDGDEVSETEELSANITLTGSLFGGRLENLALIGYSDITRDNFTDGAPSFDAEGDRTIFRYQGTLEIDARNTLAFGAEREEQSSGDDDTSIDGLFALYEVQPTDQLTLTAGIRVDDHERFGTETTGRVAAAFNPTDTVTLRASWGQGFKAPTLFQTTFFCCGATAPNADLEAETSEAFDIGLDWRSADGRAEGGITYFDQDTENQINFSFALGGYENIAEVTSQGVEIYGAYQFTDWFGVAVDYAYIDAEDGDGEALSRLPEHSGDLTLAIDPPGPASGAVLVRYNGEEPNTNGTTLDAWTRVDLSGSYDLNDQVELFGRIENLFDEDYQQILGYGTPDLSGYLGVRLRY
ncbi:MAG: TonB-dependent receptor [Pseudomonadota bacterium]